MYLVLLTYICIKSFFFSALYYYYEDTFWPRGQKINSVVVPSNFCKQIDVANDDSAVFKIMLFNKNH